MDSYTAVSETLFTAIKRLVAKSKEGVLSLSVDGGSLALDLVESIMALSNEYDAVLTVRAFVHD